MLTKKLTLCLLLVLIVVAVVNARSLQENVDINERDVSERDANPDPGWIRRQLMRAGEAASNIGGKMGGFALKLTNAVDRICGIIKKVIPIVGAVCTVGQFQFCAIDNVTGGDLSGTAASPIAGPGTGIVDLNVQD